MGASDSESSVPTVKSLYTILPSQAPPEGGGIKATVCQLVVLEVELTEVGLAAQGSSGHFGDEVVLGSEKRMRQQLGATEGS